MQVSKTTGLAGSITPAEHKTAAQSPATGGFGDILQQTIAEDAAKQVNLSKHAIARAEERGINLTADLLDKLTDSVERAQEKGATNILAIDRGLAFIVNVPHSRVITLMRQDEMKENVFTNIDGAVLL